MEDMNSSMERMSLDSTHDSQRLHRADSNHSVSSTVSADSRDHKFPKTSKPCSLNSHTAFECEVDNQSETHTLLHSN